MIPKFYAKTDAQNYDYSLLKSETDTSGLHGLFPFKDERAYEKGFIFQNRTLLGYHCTFPTVTSKHLVKLQSRV